MLDQAKLSILKIIFMENIF